MGKHINKRHEQPASIRKNLSSRCRSLVKYTDNIKKDLERDCIPYWKLDVLKEKLNDLADDLKEFM